MTRGRSDPSATPVGVKQITGWGSSGNGPDALYLFSGNAPVGCVSLSNVPIQRDSKIFAVEISTGSNGLAHSPRGSVSLRPRRTIGAE
jgi:hypothetical protein